MKKIILIIFLSLIFMGLHLLAAQETLPFKENPGEILLKSKVTDVTVYRDRALVTRQAVKTLPQGEHMLIFTGLPDNIIEGSIHADGHGNAILKDIKYREIYITVPPDEKTKTLYANHDLLENEIAELNDQIRLIEEQKQFLTKIIDKITAEDDKTTATQLDPDGWIKMVEFFRTKNQTLDTELRQAKKNLAEKLAQLNILNDKINDLGKKSEKWVKQVLVTLIISNPGEIQLNLSYVVTGPRWFPLYDLRISSEKKEITITTNAVIKQNTGEDWRNVKINLSTANPAVGSQHPELFPHYVSFFHPVAPAITADVTGEVKPAEFKSSAENVFVVDGVAVLDPEVTGKANELKKRLEPTQPMTRITQETATIDTKVASVIFSLKGNTSIASDNQDHKTTIMSGKYPASFRYSTVPKLTPMAYLKTQVQNNTDYPLLAGNANIFLDNAFISTSQLNYIAPGEKSWIFLGPDENIKVDYQFIKDTQGDKGFFKGKNVLTFQGLFKITNNKKTEEEIVIWDQLPISQHEDIVIELIEPKIKKDTNNLKINNQNFLEWFYTLKPGQEISIPIKYSITFPKEKKITIQ